MQHRHKKLDSTRARKEMRGTSGEKTHKTKSVGCSASASLYAAVVVRLTHGAAAEATLSAAAAKVKRNSRMLEGHTTALCDRW